jgi:hypothetical protein
VATGVAYLALVASLFTGVYHPLGVGDDRSGWVLLVFAAAQLALGAAWPTAWSFALPLPIGIAGVIVASHVDEPIGVAFAVISIPVAYVLVAIGRLLAWAIRRRGAPERVAISVPLVLFSQQQHHWRRPRARAGTQHPPRGCPRLSPDNSRWTSTRSTACAPMLPANLPPSSRHKRTRSSRRRADTRAGCSQRSTPLPTNQARATRT